MNSALKIGLVVAAGVVVLAAAIFFGLRTLAGKSGGFEVWWEKVMAEVKRLRGAKKEAPASAQAEPTTGL